MKLNNKKGFTLIELLIVIAVLGILASIGIMKYTSFLEMSKFKTDALALNELSEMVEHFYDLEGIYPSQSGVISGQNLTQQEVMNHFVNTFYGAEGISVKADYGYLSGYLKSKYTVVQGNYVKVEDFFIYIDEEGHDNYYIYIDEAGNASISDSLANAYVNSTNGVKASQVTISN